MFRRKGIEDSCLTNRRLLVVDEFSCSLSEFSFENRICKQNYFFIFDGLFDGEKSRMIEVQVEVSEYGRVYVELERALSGVPV